MHASRSIDQRFTLEMCAKLRTREAPAAEGWALVEASLEIWPMLCLCTFCPWCSGLWRARREGNGEDKTALLAKLGRKALAPPVAAEKALVVAARQSWA